MKIQNELPTGPGSWSPGKRPHCSVSFHKKGPGVPGTPHLEGGKSHTSARSASRPSPTVHFHAPLLFPTPLPLLLPLKTVLETGAQRSLQLAGLYPSQGWD